MISGEGNDAMGVLDFSGRLIVCLLWLSSYFMAGF